MQYQNNVKRFKIKENNRQNKKTTMTSIRMKLTTITTTKQKDNNRVKNGKQYTEVATLYNPWAK